MSRRIVIIGVLAVGSLPAGAGAQPLVKAAVSVDAGATKPTGETFGYRLTYNCSSTSGPCGGAEVIDLLPPELQLVSTVPASPSGDVASVDVTHDFLGTGRTRVAFDLIDPLPAGNSGDLILNVRFPVGSTPDGTVATNTADGVNLETTPGTFTTPSVDVTAVASVQTSLQKTLRTGPANLDLPEAYRLRVSVPNAAGALELTAVGPITDTLPPGTVFDGATPAADCEPGCVGTTPATLQWTSPCPAPVRPGESCDVVVDVTFPGATFTSGTDVTNSFVADATPLGQPPQTFGPARVTHPVTIFVPEPDAGLQKRISGGSPNPPTLDQTFSYQLVPSNDGNVPLDEPVWIDDVPVEMVVDGVTTGAYDDATGTTTVSYETNLSGGFVSLGSSPVGTDARFPIPALAAGEFVTRLRWELSDPIGTGFRPAGSGRRPRITGRIVEPDNSGDPVPLGTSIENCGELSAVHAAGPTTVQAGPTCRTFSLSGPFVRLRPAKDALTGGGPFAPGQSVSYRLRVWSDDRSSDQVPVADLVSTDLLPVDLELSSWTFDDRGTGLPAPQVFEEIPNFAGTGRTLLRWRWNGGSGSLSPGEQVWVEITTSIRDGAVAGGLANTFTLEHDGPVLGQRCHGSSTSDALDLDEDGDTVETLCRDAQSVDIAGIAQLVSSKTIQGTCDAVPVSTSQGSLTGGRLEYRLRVRNVGTVPMEQFVLVDILPFVGDTGVRDTGARGSEWTPLLVAPITPPAGTTIEYSTAGDPCRGEVGGPTSGCDPPGWSTVPPEPITSVRSFKIELGDRVVEPFDSVELAVPMTTPGTVPVGAPAYNSFAYRAERADGLGSLAAEPRKVGVSLGSCDAARLGDRVWVDLDGDGVQDDGPSGLDGVLVRLFEPGGDGLPATGDDGPLATAVTAAGPAGGPGWYSFPGLAPGDYVVCIDPPPTFEPTRADQGGDDGADSDGDPVTGCSSVVTLPADTALPGVDFGLVPTERAALGDHVWLDRDGDGVQDESPFDGVNGVTVRLWADDGDGVAEPGGGDALVAATVTRDDVHGRPGYYLFDGLIPGTPYFVQFVLPPAAAGFSTAGAGPDGTDSDADPGDGTTAVVTPAAGAVDRTLDAGLVPQAGPLSLGDQVWLDGDDDGIYEPQDGEAGIDGVRLELYRDADGDGEPSFGEHVGTSSTSTRGGFAGRYRFDDLPAGDYIVAVATPSLTGGGALFGLLSSTGNDPAPDPDDDANGDDNGTAAGALVASLPVTLSGGAEPTTEDGDDDTNLTVDLGFVPDPGADPPAFDYGDAPDVVSGGAAGDYRTTVLDRGAAHRVGLPGAPFLGACVDADDGLRQNVAADDDDGATFGPVAGACEGGDDEDGVSFGGPFTPGSPAVFQVTAGGAACSLDAWVDWNRNGLFGDAAGEQIAAAVAVVPGSPTVLTPTVPAGAVAGLTYARFRCSTAGGLGPSGFAADGEVEDHALAVLGADFGDAPSGYGTLFAGGGPHHRVVPGFSLGATVDAETDGLPSAAATDDGADEDGVALPGALTACTAANLTVTLTDAVGVATPLLDAWIDFDGDGGFDGPRDRIATGFALSPGANTLPVAVPCDAGPAASFARFRLSSGGVSGPGGPALDGEVEDWAVTVEGLDFGDAPDPTYPTLLASNGARHRVSPAGGPSLGALVDTEAEGRPSAGVVGDDGSGVDDEDGVVVPSVLIPGTDGVLEVTAGAVGGLVTCWIDFDRDGAWSGAEERVVTDLSVASGATVTPSFPVPAGSPDGSAPARCRIGSRPGPGVSGEAPDGEVEDHPVPVGVESPALGVAKRVVAVERVPDEPTLFRVRFEIAVENLGNVPLSDMDASSVLATVFDAPRTYQVQSLTSPGLAVNPAFDGDAVTGLLASGQTLGVGSRETLLLEVVVDPAGAPGPYECSAVARGTSPAGAPVSDVSQEGEDPDPDGDGDAADDDEPTLVLLPVSVLEIPTLERMALLLLALLLASVGLWRMRG